MYKVQLYSKEFWLHTGIPECFIGSVLDKKRFQWDDAVEALLQSIPNVVETGCYGEYTVCLSYKEGEPVPEDVEAYVQSYVDKFEPPFDYED